MKKISRVVHEEVVRILREHAVHTVLDVGGVGKLNQLSSDLDVLNVNLRMGIDGCALPFKDRAFDATCSIAVVEHVADAAKFLSEALRVSTKVSVHWFPRGPAARVAESLKRRAGHKHPCVLHALDMTQGFPALKAYSFSPFMSCREHFALLQEARPRLHLDAKDLGRHIDEPYGYMLKLIRKDT